MGVYIKDMQLPDMCGHCRFAAAFDCEVTGKFIVDHKVRNADCPLIEITEPHGDLIDRQELCGVIEQLVFYWDYGRHIPDCWNALLDAPTIIPASEEG